MLFICLCCPGDDIQLSAFQTTQPEKVHSAAGFIFFALFSPPLGVKINFQFFTVFLVFLLFSSLADSFYGATRFEAFFLIHNLTICAFMLLFSPLHAPVSLCFFRLLEKFINLCLYLREENFAANIFPLNFSQQLLSEVATVKFESTSAMGKIRKLARNMWESFICAENFRNH